MVESSIAARVRAFEISPELFRKLALLAAGMLYLIVVTGATVRLTASGLGCDHWPGCQAGQPFPEKGYHSYIEFGNRLVGGIAIVCTLVAALAALRAPRLPTYARRTAIAVFAGTMAQAPLGYLTVKFHLNPYLVMSHFLLSALVLAGAVVVVVAALGAERGTAEPLVPRELRAAAAPAAAGCLVLLVTGTVATAAGPHPGDSTKVHRLWRLQDAVFGHAVGTAIFGICFAFMLGYLASRRSLSPRLFALTLGVLGLVAVQIAIGATQYHTRLPWWLVLIHVATAAAVWTAIVALAALFVRPLAWLRPNVN
jgi:cytochrome c oxidase assembly protein subunit 15